MKDGCSLIFSVLFISKADFLFGRNIVKHYSQVSPRPHLHRKYKNELGHFAHILGLFPIQNYSIF